MQTPLYGDGWPWNTGKLSLFRKRVSGDIIGPCLLRMSVPFRPILDRLRCQVNQEHSNPVSGTGNDQRSALDTRHDLRINRLRS